MTTTPNIRPRSFPHLGHGGGSLGWDETRQLVILQHQVGGKRYVERGYPTKAVIAKRDERRRRLANPQPAVATSAGMTLGELLAEWLPLGASGKSQSTVDGYTWAIRYLTARHGDLALAEINPGRVSIILLGVVQAGLTKGSLRKLRSTLSMACAHGVACELMRSNPVRSAVTPGGAAAPRPHKWYDETEHAQMRRHLVTHHTTGGTVLLVGLLCGLRPGEALGLRWDAIDFEAGELAVDTQLRYHTGNPTGELTGVLKTDHTGHLTAHRVVPMPTDLVAALRRERSAQLARSGRSDHVFTMPAGHHPKASWLNAQAITVARLAGLPHVNPNGYRHSFASLLMLHGMAPVSVAKLMGHRNTLMIETVYGHPPKSAPATAGYLGAAVEMG